jgi:hypothetical protein
MKSFIRVLLFGCLVLPALALAAAPFEGSYKANGKDAKLAYLTARKGDAFAGHPVTILVFSEKDPGNEKDPGFKAQMGDLGDALVVHLSKDGEEWDIIGTEFAHAALKHSGASGTGILSVKDVKLAAGELSGHLFTKPGSDLFDEPLAIDLKFHVKQP